MRPKLLVTVRFDELITFRQVADALAKEGGAQTSAQVLAAIELGRRTLVRTHADRPRLNTPRQLASYLLPQHGSRPVEQFEEARLYLGGRLHLLSRAGRRHEHPTCQNQRKEQTSHGSPLCDRTSAVCSHEIVRA